MKNSEKYITAEERSEAFRSFCKGRECEHCPVKIGGTVDCKFNWLDLEAEEENLLPCPFCGSNTVVKSYVTVRHVDNHLVECTNCQYRSEEKFDRDCAIAAHNRVARAVMEAAKCTS